MAEAAKTSDNDGKTAMSAYTYDKESTMQNTKKEVSNKTEIESNLQTPLMFSRSSSLGSLSGFDQLSVHDDHSSVVSDFSTRTSGIMSPTSEISKSSSRLATSQGNQQKSQYNENLPPKKTQPQVKLQVFDEMSFQYDSAFKKPHFMKHSVFEDDIAAFKDESSPNVLSTAASSLSSLTIDDDEYGENISPNKAGLIKKKCNSTNILHMQKTSVPENWHQNSVVNSHMPSENSSNNQVDQTYNNRHKFTLSSVENGAVNEKENKFTNTAAYDEQSCWESQKCMRYPEQFSNDIKKSNMYLSSHQLNKDNQRSYTDSETCRDQTLFRPNCTSKSQQIAELNNCNKHINRLMREQDNRLMREQDNRLMREQDSRLMREQDNRLMREQDSRLVREQDNRLMREQEIRLMREHENRLMREQDSRLMREQDNGLMREQDNRLMREQDNRLMRERDSRLIREHDNRLAREQDNRIMREQDNRLLREQDETRENEEFSEDLKGSDPRRRIKEVNHQVDEVDLNAYEEALLDQCIRKGMAKVTKRNMSDIKPFCWDLNHICLTTRALLKTRDEELLKEKKDERNKRRISYKGLSRRLSNSRVK